jgi:hypothetical protein
MEELEFHGANYGVRRNSSYFLIVNFLTFLAASQTSGLSPSFRISESLPWTDTDQYRGEIRRSAEKTLKTLSENQG